MPTKAKKPLIKKDSDSSKYNRINQIYTMLKNNSAGMTISELAKCLDVSTKTIQRDLYEVLVDFGAVKKGRIWKIDSKLTKDGLNKDEKLILGILDEMAKGAGKVFYSKAHSLLEQISQQIDNSVFTNVNSEYLENKNLEIFST
ncbi:MAG: HTH domain-containing protein, partial [Arcobacter skirrowii]|nr:HTH domain-containing protein [Aliarcobacter skirrowii]